MTMAEMDSELDSKAHQQPSGLSRWTPSLPTNLMSMLNPFSNEDADKANSEGNTSVHSSNKRNSILSSFLPTLSTSEPPPSPDKEENLMFAEPENESNSDASREGSVVDSERRRSKRSNRPKTCYSLCHPPTTSSTRRKLHRRPRSLLQLHKLSTNARPQPAIEVIPSANFSVRLTKAITKVFKTKHGLCPNDLVILRAEKYSADEPDEEQEARDIIALICKGRKEDGNAPGKARICLAEGTEWEAYPTLNGGYEFFSTDEHGLGLTVRWVPKKLKDGGKAAKDASNKKFTFSTISPNSRQHPVIATLSKTELDINDTYKMPNANAATPLSTPKIGPTVVVDTMAEESEDKERRCQTDDRLRQIIVMTGIWVAFKEGWTPTYKYDDKDKDFITAAQRSPSLQYSPQRTATFQPPVASTPPASPGLEKRSSFKAGILRTSSLLNKSNRNSTISVPEGEEEPAVSGVEPTKTGRKRADSASTVLVHRAASNRTKNRHQATWRPDLLASQNDMQESSHEDLSRKASMPSPSTEVPSPSEAWPSTIPPKGRSIAQPILPPTNANGVSDQETDNENIAPTRRAQTTQPPATDKRESSRTTTNTSSSGAPSKQAVSKKRSGWRRLLCGSHHDV